MMRPLKETIYRSALKSELCVLKQVFRWTHTKPYHPLPWIGLKLDETKDPDRIRHRCTRVKSVILESNSRSVLDVGGNVGYMAFRIAGPHTFVLLVESNPLFVRCAEICRELIGRNNYFDNVAVWSKRLLLPDIMALPDFDACLYLSVHHHLCRDHGWKYAEMMLAQLLRKTRKVFFFEISSNPKWVEHTKIEDVMIWAGEFFNARGWNVSAHLDVMPDRPLIVATPMGSQKPIDYRKHMPNTVLKCRIEFQNSERK